MGVRGQAVRRAVFLDRDGVINEAVLRDGKPYPPPSVTQVRIAEDAGRALGRLKSMGFRLAVVTNQPDVARGTQAREAVEAINEFLAARLPLDAFYVCYHDEADNCACRKPRPGLILDAARALDVDPASGFVIGDRWRDIAAGRAAGCRTVWIDRAYAEPAPVEYDFRAESLSAAVDWIVSQAAK